MKHLLILQTLMLYRRPLLVQYIISPLPHNLLLYHTVCYISLICMLSVIIFVCELALRCTEKSEITQMADGDKFSKVNVCFQNWDDREILYLLFMLL